MRCKYFIKWLLKHLSNQQHKNSEELKKSALEIIHNLYPETEWSHIYTDGSKLSPTGTGDFFKIIEVSEGVGTNSSNFDGEIEPVQLTVEELANYHPATATICFIDSQAVIQFNFYLYNMLHGL